MQCNGAFILSGSVFIKSEIKPSRWSAPLPRNRFDITNNWSIIHFLLPLGRNCMTRIVNQLMKLLAIKREKWFQQLLPLFTKDKQKYIARSTIFSKPRKAYKFVRAELLLQCLSFCGRKTCFKNVSYQTISLPCEPMHARSNSTFWIVAATYFISP